MGRTAKVTRDDIRAACERISERGEQVKLETVRAELGGIGSNSTIHPHWAEWQAEQEAAEKGKAEQQPGETKEETPVPFKVAAALDAGKLALAAIGPAVSEAINAATADQARAHRGQLEVIEATWQGRVDAATQSLKESAAREAALAEDGRRYEDEIETLRDQLETSGAEVAHLTGELAAEKQAHQAARADATARAAEIDALHQTVKEAQARATAAEVAQQTAERHAVTAATAQEKAELARDQADAERRQVIDQGTAQAKKDAELIERLTAQRDQAREERAAEEARADQLVERLAAERADLTARIDAATAERDMAHTIRAEAQAAAVEARSTLDQALRRASQAEAEAVRAGADLEKWREKANERADEIKALKAAVAEKPAKKEPKP